MEINGNEFKNKVLDSILKYLQNFRYNINEEEKILFINDNYTYTCKGCILGERNFYNYFNINWENKISKQLRPDICIFINGTIFIIECKFQQVDGSVDEKLQTCDFKKKQYEKLMFGSNIKVEYVYVLNNYFYNPKYKDVLDYIKSVKCYYYFENQIDILIDNIIKFGVLY